MFRVARLTPQRLAGLLLGFALLASPLVGFAGAASSRHEARISAHLSARFFTSSQARSVKLVYRFSKPSRSFSYRISIKKGKKWQLVTRVETIKTLGYFKGEREISVKKLFAGKPISVGSYRLKLSTGKGGTTLGFRVAKVIPAVTTGADHTCALLSNGTVKCWGSNADGQLGDDTTASWPYVRVSGIVNAIQVSAGRSHTCALLSSRKIKCWGDGDAAPTPVSGITNAIEVSAGADHTCALLSNRAIECWGSNDYGQLGDGTTTSRPTPVEVSGISNAVQVSAGVVYTCAVLGNGAVKCWGLNDDGQLGVGTIFERAPRTTPVRVKDISNAVRVSASKGGCINNWAPCGTHTCAVLSDGTARCWGFDGNHELGIGEIPKNGRAAIPSRVVGITKAIAIGTGSSHSCSLLSDGTVRCWGANAGGSLGDGAASHVAWIEGGDVSPTPVKVIHLTDAVQLDVGDVHACAITSSGVVKCWGANYYGQLGNGKVGYSTTPVRVIGIP